MADETHLWSGAFNDLDPSDQLVVAQLVVKGRAVSKPAARAVLSWFL